MADAQAEKPTPAYVSYATLKNFFITLKKGIPGRIDKSVMTNLSGATQTQLIHALKYLKLIASNGVPHQNLTLLVNSEGAERQKVLQEVLRGAYPFLRDPSFKLDTATTALLDEQFEKLAQGDTVRKCKTFFLPAAKDAGLAVSPHIKEVGKRTPSNGRPRKARPAPAASPAAAPAGLAAGATASSNAPPVASLSWHELLLAKFPSFDPSWPDDVKAKWFQSFQELMGRGINKEGGS